MNTSGGLARLRDFLLYVGRQSLKEGAHEINEQDVGAHVFGRSPAYDRSQDNIVRVNATELRRRIETYFETEGAGETLILEIPRGGYRPVFHPRIARDPAEPITHSPLGVYVPSLPGSPPERDASAPANPTRIHVFWASACLLVALAAGYLYQQNTALRNPEVGWNNRPALAAFWGSFFASIAKPTSFCPMTPSASSKTLRTRPSRSAII